MPDNRGDPVNILSFDFVKDRYDFELERKNKLTGDLALPIGVLSGLGGLAATMARSFTYKIPFLTVAALQPDHAVCRTRVHGIGRCSVRCGSTD